MVCFVCFDCFRSDRLSRGATKCALSILTVEVEVGIIEGIHSFGSCSVRGGPRIGVRFPSLRIRYRHPGFPLAWCYIKEEGRCRVQVAPTHSPVL